LTENPGVDTQHPVLTNCRRCPKVRRASVLVLVALTATLVAGCPSIWKKELIKKDAPPKELFQAAQDQFQQKNYREAIELYERLKSAQPDFDKIPEAYQRIADAFFNLGEYDEAVARYQQFLQLYPNHEDRYRAKYMIGMSYFDRIKGTDREDSMVRRAEAEFKQVADDSAAGQWKKKAEEKYRECRKKLAEMELYKAKTYISTGQYKSARIAAQRILDEYAKLGLDKEASDIIEKVKGK